MKSIVLAAAAAAALVTGTPLVHAQTKITFGSWWPAVQPENAAFEEYAKRVTQQSGGSIRFEIHHDGKVSNLRTGLPSLNNSIVDMALINGVAHKKEMPIEAMILDHAAQQSNPFAMSAAVYETALTLKETRDEAARNRIVPLGYAAHSGYYLMCNDRVAGVDWFKGKSVRGTAAFSRFPQSMGATPVFTQPSELYEMMQRKQVSCAIGQAVWLQSLSLMDVVKFVYDFPLGQSNNNMYAISTDVWKSLSDRDRKILLDNVPFLMRRNAELQVEQVEQVRKVSAAKGVQWLPLPDDVKMAYGQFARNDARAVADNAKASGVADPDKILRTWKEILTRWEKAFSSQVDGNAYEAAVRTQALSKF
jgi:TRAP-type C4-dicarboxylate transport system substrate-binding protein